MVARMSTGLYRVMPLCKLPRIIAGLCYHRHSTCLCLAVGKEPHAYRSANALCVLGRQNIELTERSKFTQQRQRIIP